MVLREQLCILAKCNTKIMVDDKLDIPDFCFASDFCKFHKKVNKLESKIFQKLVPKYNELKLKDKFGRIIKFEWDHEVRNYMYSNEKRKYNKIKNRAEKIIKKREAKNK